MQAPSTVPKSIQSRSKLLARSQILLVLATFPCKTRFYRIAAIIHRFKATQASNPLHYARIHHCREKSTCPSQIRAWYAAPNHYGGGTSAPSNYSTFCHQYASLWLNSSTQSVEPRQAAYDYTRNGAGIVTGFFVFVFNNSAKLLITGSSRIPCCTSFYLH